MIIIEKMKIITTVTIDVYAHTNGALIHVIVKKKKIKHDRGKKKKCC